MQSTTGSWVSGNNFFDRKSELKILEYRVLEGNHTLLSGQRRMGKTSIVRELGRRLEEKGWTFLYVDVEKAETPEDLVTCVAEAAHSIPSIRERISAGLKRWLGESIEEMEIKGFRLKFRASLNTDTWQYHGEQLIARCAGQNKPLFLVIDELPILLKRMLDDGGGAQRVDVLLSWLRSASQTGGSKSPVFFISGSIGLEPLVRRLGLSDRINHLASFGLEPWSRDVSVECFERLSESHGLPVENGVAYAVYDQLGLGIPHHIQSFFARLREYAIMHDLDRVTVANVAEVYDTILLGPRGQSDLFHYEERLMHGLDIVGYTIALEILADAAILDVFTLTAMRSLENLYSSMGRDARDLIAEVLDVLNHDGYLEDGGNGHRFRSRLLKDWWASRYRGHHIPLTERLNDSPG